MQLIISPGCKILLAFAVLLLASCAAVDRKAEPVDIADDTSTLAWNSDTQQQSAAVRQLVQQADARIAADDLETAEVILNRALRISNRVASIWSRLAWLSLERQQNRRARDYVTRSNSLTSDNTLLRFNWQLFYQASLNLGDSGGLSRSKQMLQKLD